LRCYLAEGNICCYLNRHCPVLFAHTGSWARPQSSFRLQLSLLRKVFAGCCQSLLEDGPSRRYLRIPCIGAWTPTPPRLSGAFACFFPENIGLTSRFKSSARKTIPAMQLQQGSIFRGCSHSIMFRLPCLLDPPVAPTAVGFAHRAAGPFTPRNGRVVTLHELWHRYIPEPGNWYGGTFTHWNAALSAATESLNLALNPYVLFHANCITYPPFFTLFGGFVRVLIYLS
jgi:hypothetical protein